MKNHTAEPAEIEDRLYLGSYSNTYDKDLLERYNIKYILNLAKPLCKDHFPDIIEYKSFGVETYLKDRKDLLNVLDESLKFIEEKKKEGCILVHCAGMARSSAVITAYLMKTRCIPYSTAWELVKASHSDATMTIGFKNQLANISDKA